MIAFKKLIFAGLILFFFFSLTRNFFEYRKNLQFYDQYRKEHEAEVKKNNELKAQLVKNNDSYEMEKRIRNKLNLLKENEVAVLLPEPSPTPTIVLPTAVPVHEQWRNVFFSE